MKVCLIVEGAYPYVNGGMSNWIQQLMLYMKDTEFIVQSIAAKREETRSFKYQIPDNCLEIQEVYLLDDDYMSNRRQKRLKMTSEAVSYTHLVGILQTECFRFRKSSRPWTFSLYRPQQQSLPNHLKERSFCKPGNEPGLSGLCRSHVQR